MRFFLLLIVTLSTFQINAQIVKNEQKIGWKGGADNVKLNSFPNKGRRLNCVFLSTSEYLKGFVYNSLPWCVSPRTNKFLTTSSVNKNSFT